MHGLFSILHLIICIFYLLYHNVYNKLNMFKNNPTTFIYLLLFVEWNFILPWEIVVQPKPDQPDLLLRLAVTHVAKQAKTVNCNDATLIQRSWTMILHAWPDHFSVFISGHYKYISITKLKPLHACMTTNVYTAVAIAIYSFAIYSYKS